MLYSTGQWDTKKSSYQELYFPNKKTSLVRKFLPSHTVPLPSSFFLPGMPHDDGGVAAILWYWEQKPQLTMPEQKGENQVCWQHPWAVAQTPWYKRKINPLFIHLCDYSSVFRFSWAHCQVVFFSSLKLSTFFENGYHPHIYLYVSLASTTASYNQLN